jgi:hypothetical protein
MTRSVHSSKGRELKVGIDAEDFPLCLHLGVKCEKSRKMCVEKISMKEKNNRKQENKASETRHNETK